MQYLLMYVCTIIALLFDIYVNVIRSRMYKIPKHLRKGKHGKDSYEEDEDEYEQIDEADDQKEEIENSKEVMEDLEIMNNEIEVLEKGNSDER